MLIIASHYSYSFFAEILFYSVCAVHKVILQEAYEAQKIQRIALKRQTAVAIDESPPSGPREKSNDVEESKLKLRFEPNDSNFTVGPPGAAKCTAADTDTKEVWTHRSTELVW